VGMQTSGRYDDMLEDVIYALQKIEKPLFIFDEAGDLDDKALLEIKRMYNALEMMCGFYLVGSNGLQAKINRGIRCDKVGYAEIFSRFGKKFTKTLPSIENERIHALKAIAEDIMIANNVKDPEAIKNVKSMLVNGSIRDMRTVQREVIKYRIQIKKGELQYDSTNY
jgi:hypothetical protein